MTWVVRTVAVVLPAVLVLAAAHGGSHANRPEARGPAVLAPLATTGSRRVAVGRRAQPLPVARRALRWLLAAEAGDGRPVPPQTFTRPLTRELAARPPRPVPGRGRARVASLREQSPVGPVRRVVAVVARGDRGDPVTLLVACPRSCRVAAVE